MIAAMLMIIAITEIILLNRASFFDALESETAVSAIVFRLSI